MKAAYVHIPFCKNICTYCDFCKMFYNETLVDKYLVELEKEIKSIYKDDILDSIYIGGGTPSTLNIKQLEQLLNICKTFKVTKNLEYTFELNLDSITKEKLLLLKDFGVNRLSIGVESLNKQNQELMNRYQSKKEIEDKIILIRSLDFNNINLDLMYAFLDEDLEILKEDLNFILSLRPEHISAYSLIIEEHTKLFIENIKNIDSDLDSKMYEYICKTLKKNNYLHYEISNFAKNGYYSKHNKTYWNNDEYYGFGLGAASYINNIRKNNTRSINHYLDHKYIYNEDKLSKKDIIDYQIILNLRLNTGINKQDFFARYNKNIDDLYDYSFLIENKLLIDDNISLFIPEDKWYISNEIIVKFLEGEKDGEV